MVSQSPEEQIPVTVLTGFLGAGKTTFLNRWLEARADKRWLVIINEFGSVGVDHDLVVQADTETETSFVELSSGCLCCTIRGDLTKTLREAPWRFARGGQRWFDEIIIETTGLADPVPIIQTFVADQQVAARYRIQRILTVVDSVNGAGTVRLQAEAAKQIAIADAIVLTKMDVATDEQRSEANATIARLNPAVAVIESSAEGPDWQAISEVSCFNPSSLSGEVRAWLSDAVYEAHGHDHHGHDHHHSHDPNRHDERIRSICLTFDEPLPVKIFDAWFTALSQLRGEDLLRVKGILNVEELPMPMVIHGVQHIWHEPEILSEWPSEDLRSRVVFIVRDLDEGQLRKVLDQLLSRLKAPSVQGL